MEVGTRVGSYELKTLLSQGGMGSVWLASRNDGRYEAQVAVKLLHRILSGADGERRFILEGQILARLSHPNIARLIDSGVSSNGYPYIALEYVKGSEIDAYCDAKELSVGDRVKLFLEVLEAVAHAHANLVVHRDLKPSNILVTDEGRVKLLDFGVAKLLEHTEGGARITLPRDRSGLTPRYAAPEQIDGETVTTATDVYALGVVLYELISGEHPAGETTQGAAEFLKMILVDDPPRPSQAAPGYLRNQISDDLDLIVMKALKKRPSERYQSAVALAEDLRRYLNHQPIRARPDSFGYRAARFTRRHRAPIALAAAGIVAVAGVTGFYTMRLAAERDRSAREAAKATRVSEVLTGLVTMADPYRTPDPKEAIARVGRAAFDLNAERIDRDLADQPEVRVELLTVIGRVYQRIGDHGKARQFLERALPLGRQVFGAEHVKVAQALNDLGTLHREQGDVAGAKPLLEECLEMRRRLLGPRDPKVATTMVELARVNKDLGFPDDSERLVREALSIRTSVFGEEHRDTATSMNDLALLLLDRGELDEAERLFRRNLEIDRRLLGPTHESTVIAQGNLGLALFQKGRAAESEALLREALTIEEKNFGADNPIIAPTLNNLAYAVLELGKKEEAQSILERAVELTKKGLGDAHPRYATCSLNLARVYLLKGDVVRAEALARRALEIRTKLMRAGDWRIAQAKSLLGGALLARGNPRDAEPLLQDAKLGLRPVPGLQGREADANNARLSAALKLSRAPSSTAVAGR